MNTKTLLKKNTIHTVAVLLAVLLSLLPACVTRSGEKPVASKQPVEETTKAVDIGDVPLHEKYAPYFAIGTAISPYQLETHEKILAFHFSHLTPENNMKFANIHRREDIYGFSGMDMVTDFAREHGMRMTGHALVWHSQNPKWLFEGLVPGNPDDIERLSRRLESHIGTLAARYGDVIDNWDVVNEAVSETEGLMYRTGEESGWYNIFGSEEFIYLAFIYTEAALDANDSEALLFYNDYNVARPEKLEKIMKMAAWLHEKGARIDGIGFQGHWNMTEPSIDELKAAFDTIIEGGLKIKISELDISVYKDDWTTSTWEDEKPFTAELEREQAGRYGELFTLFREYSDHITEVTFWGMSDDRTWLDRFPVVRNNYPLLFDDDLNAKQAYHAIIDF
ncbi:MAG: endo-1,4-beta-xylanase [Spirochaetales bacterium]|nr:endo-1,4-beta-xylanase [Spirochaetales bacterium]